VAEERLIVDPVRLHAALYERWERLNDALAAYFGSLDTAYAALDFDVHYDGGKRRLRACVEAWPDCWTGGYDPRCCRFPKSCSCTCWDPQYVAEADLEPVQTGGVDGA
jgi:hypothetical protein